MEEIQLLIARVKSSGLSLPERSAAFDEIVRRFQDMAFGCAYAVLGDFCLAEDAAQEAFIEAWRSLSNLDEPKAFAGWFRRIVLRQCNRLTRGKTVVTTPLDDAFAIASDTPHPQENLEREELRGLLHDAIRTLPAHEMLVTTLFYISEYSQSEIADFLEIPVATIKTRLHSARSRLKKGMMTMVQENLQQNRPSRDDTFVTNVRRTMGRWPTFGELIEYYSRDDICAVIYYQSKRWRILMEFQYAKYHRFKPVSEKDTRERIVGMLRQFCGVEDDAHRLWWSPKLHMLRDRGMEANMRYDFMVALDFDFGWRKAAQETTKVLDVLDAHEVFYQIKFAQEGELDLIIPAESFPKTFRGKSVNEQFGSLQDRIRSYLPIPEVPDDAVQRNERFLHTAFDSQEKSVAVPPSVFEPHPVRAYAGEPQVSEAEILGSINSEDVQERVAATRAALTQNVQLPIAKLASLLNTPNRDAVWMGMEIALRDVPKMSVSDVLQMLGHVVDFFTRRPRYDGFLHGFGERYQQVVASTLSVEALCGFLASQHEISRETAAAASILAKQDWQAFVDLPARLDAGWLEGWFRQAWVVCGSALGSIWGHKSAAILDSAIQHAKAFEASEVETADKIRQLELLSQLRNTKAQKAVEDTPLFQAANALVQYGHDLKGVTDAMLHTDSANPAFYGATRLVARFLWDGAIDRVIDCLDSTPSRSQSALQALVDIGPPAVPTLEHALNSPQGTSRGHDVDRDIRRAIGMALGKIGDPVAVPALIQALRDKQPAVPSQAAIALGQIGDTAALPPLIGTLKNDKDNRVRQDAATALGKIGDATAVAAMRQALYQFPI